MNKRRRFKAKRKRALRKRCYYCTVGLTRHMRGTLHEEFHDLVLCTAATRLTLGRDLDDNGLLLSGN